MDAFDLFWQWADKPLESSLTIRAELHRAVMEFAAEERRDRAAVSQTAARTRPRTHSPPGGRAVTKVRYAPRADLPIGSTFIEGCSPLPSIGGAVCPYWIDRAQIWQ
jgi:hypothetical protein